MAKLLLLGCALTPEFRLCHFHSSTFSICNPPLALSSSQRPHPHRFHILSSRQWNSNAESFDFDAQDEAAERWDELLYDYIDSIWIIKVFKSFGWMLPSIIISMLLTTGPKAFLLALALPIGQSTFAFAIQRFLNRDKIKHKPITRTKANRGRRPRRNYSSRNVKFKGTEAKSNMTQEGIKKNKGFQSWASENNASVNNGGWSASDFGGWDELDEVVMESNVEPTTKGGGVASGFERASGEKGITGKWSAKNGPLLLRLLVSTFPFLRLLIETLL